MKAEELMIGNYITGVHVDDAGKYILEQVIVIDYAFNTVNGIDIEQWKPIVLEQEALSRLGIKLLEVDETTEISDNGFNYKYSFTFNNRKFSFDYVKRIELKHVHQLQNLYFALTGEELKLKTDGDILREHGIEPVNLT